MDVGAVPMMFGTGAASPLPSVPLELAAQVPATYCYVMGSLLLLVAFVYNMFDFHVVGDVLRGCRGNRVILTFNPASELCQHIIPKCRLLHSRYLVTPWLASPHIQTAFINFFGNPPKFAYRRLVFHVFTEEVVALDWLLPSDVAEHPHPSNSEATKTISKDDDAPIVVVIPGLRGNSSCPYTQHLVYTIAKRGWNVVVSNHRGMGGIPVKSECHYNAGLTDDIRKVIQHLHQEYPRAPLFAVGMSMGANLLVNYLGEEGIDTPLAGFISLLSLGLGGFRSICERFLSRGPIQKIYNRALASALKDYAQMNQSAFSKLVDWEALSKSRLVREYDANATCPIMNYETVDTYYRQCSSVNGLSNVSVPLLCVSALDDPVCSKEVIPWDECRANKNIVLAAAPHGGHMAFFKGLCASSLWWVEAVDEFLGVLHSSPFMHGEKKTQTTLDVEVRVVINGGADEDGSECQNNEQADAQNVECFPTSAEQQGEEKEAKKEAAEKENVEPSVQSISGSEYHVGNDHGEMASETKHGNHQISKRSTKSIWILTYIVLTTTWPLISPIFAMTFKRKSKNILSAAFLRG